MRNAKNVNSKADLETKKAIGDLFHCKTYLRIVPLKYKYTFSPNEVLINKKE